MLNFFMQFLCPMCLWFVYTWRGWTWCMCTCQFALDECVITLVWFLSLMSSFVFFNLVKSKQMRNANGLIDLHRILGMPSLDSQILPFSWGNMLHSPCVFALLSNPSFEVPSLFWLWTQGPNHCVLCRIENHKN